MPSVQRAAFSATTVHQGRGFRLVLEGNADAEVNADLAQYLAAVHDQARSLHVSEVTVDFRSLYFMTSSCFKCFITWISSIEELDEGSRYTVRLEANAKLHWQQRSFDALRSFSSSIVTLSV